MVSSMMGFGWRWPVDCFFLWLVALVSLGCVLVSTKTGGYYLTSWFVWVIFHAMAANLQSSIGVNGVIQN